MEMLKAINLVVRFVLELCILGAVGYWGFTSGPGWLGKVGLGIGTPLLTAVLWGLWGAPNSTFHLHGLLLFIFELIIFGAGPVALYAAGQPTLAIIFGVVYIVNKVLMMVWQQ